MTAKRKGGGLAGAPAGERALFTVLGPDPAPLQAARRETAYQRLVIFTPAPDGDAVARVREMEALAGAAPEVVPVDPGDLLACLRAMGDALRRHGDARVRFQVNGGGDNRLTHAALLCCFEHGVDAWFCHEKGTTRLPVIQRAAVHERFGADEKRVLAAMDAEAAVAVDAVARAAGAPRARAVAALLELKRKGLVSPEGPRVRLNAAGRYYRDHFARPPPPGGPG